MSVAVAERKRRVCVGMIKRERSVCVGITRDINIPGITKRFGNVACDVNVTHTLRVLFFDRYCIYCRKQQMHSGATLLYM